MKGLVSFHPVDLTLFDELIAPLAAGRKVNPESYLQRAPRVRQTAWIARRYVIALEQLAMAAEAPKAEPTASPWQRLRANLERMDYKPDESARRAARVFDTDLHLDGRPFFISEGSAERVSAAVDAYVAADTDVAADKIARDQLSRVDSELAKALEPADLAELPSDLGYRSDLLALLTKIHDLARLAREGRAWVDPDVPPRPAADALPEELPWRAVSLHSRVMPFWVARDVDGLETICRAAGVPPPDCLGPAWRVFAEACEAFPALKSTLGLELRRPKDVGAYVAANEVGSLLTFLSDHGAKIINAATRAGEGATATSLLRKIKECAVYAQHHNLGYLEACGVVPSERE
jgi:hypothetical protein